MPESIMPIPDDLLPAVLALNNRHAADLSWLDADRLSTLVDRAFEACCIADGEAFLIAFDQAADYDSPNFRWFQERYERFVYVDRVAVSAAARGRGHARRLYEHLFRRAGEAGHDIVVCEVNSDPPNPASDAFHAALGFTEVGSAAIHDGGKKVRYYLRRLVERGDGLSR